MFNELELMLDGYRLRSEGDSGAAPAETVEEGTEVVSEVVEETLRSEPTEDALDLSGIPDEYHEAIRQQVVQKVRGQVESGFTQKFQTQAEKLKALEAEAAIVRQFNENFEKDPEGVIEFLKSKAPQKSVVPENPGPAPDPIESPDEFSAWLDKRDAYNRYEIEQNIRQQYGDVTQTQQVLKQIQQERAMAQTRAAIGATEEEFAKVLEVRNALAQDPNAAFKFILDSLKTKTSTAAHAREAINGTEERPGLQRSGARREVPKPTGNKILDAVAELEAEGIKFPGEV